MEKRVRVWVQCPGCTYEHEVTLPAPAIAPFEEDDDGTYRHLPYDPAFLCHDCLREHENVWMKDTLEEQAVEAAMVGQADITVHVEMSLQARYSGRRITPAALRAAIREVCHV